MPGSLKIRYWKYLGYFFSRSLMVWVQYLRYPHPPQYCIRMYALGFVLLPRTSSGLILLYFTDPGTFVIIDCFPSLTSCSYFSTFPLILFHCLTVLALMLSACSPSYSHFSHTISLIILCRSMGVLPLNTSETIVIVNLFSY